jgi:hypothetical protein
MSKDSGFYDDLKGAAETGRVESVEGQVRTTTFYYRMADGQDSFLVWTDKAEKTPPNTLREALSLLQKDKPMAPPGTAWGSA